MLSSIPFLGCNSAEGAALSTPPELIITVGNKSITAILGTYSWNIYNKDGSVTSIKADSAAPPELVKYQKETLSVKAKSSIVLNFDSKPKNYTVSIWQDDNPIIQEVTDGVIVAPQQKGLVIYEVSVEWKQGTANYAFSVNID